MQWDSSAGNGDQPASTSAPEQATAAMKEAAAADGVADADMAAEDATTAVATMDNGASRDEKQDANKNPA